MKITKNRARAAAGAAALAVVASGMTAMLAAPSAQAAERNGVCETGEFCYSYNSGFTGSVSDHIGSLADYGTTAPSCYVFKSAAAGQNLCIKNNAASAWNRTTSPVTVYFNTNYGGSSQVIAANTKVDLNATLKNNNASHRIGVVATKPKMSYSIYKLSGGFMLCKFDGYGIPPCGSFPGYRHEGIDLKRGYGSNVYALVSGKVVRVTEGSAPSGLSTIAIYNATLNKTIVYLHSNPSVVDNQIISKGQLIGTESYRGAGSQSNSHTHVEMRPGYVESAAISRDSTLVNPNPNTFWASQGYTVG